MYLLSLFLERCCSDRDVRRHYSTEANGSFEIERPDWGRHVVLLAFGQLLALCQGPIPAQLAT